MMLTAGCVFQANDTYTKVIDLYECPPLFIYHNLMLEFVMQMQKCGWDHEEEERKGEREGNWNHRKAEKECRKIKMIMQIRRC